MFQVILAFLESYLKTHLKIWMMKLQFTNSVGNFPLMSCDTKSASYNGMNLRHSNSMQLSTPCICFEKKKVVYTVQFSSKETSEQNTRCPHRLTDTASFLSLKPTTPTSSLPWIILPMWTGLAQRPKSHSPVQLLPCRFIMFLITTNKNFTDGRIGTFHSEVTNLILTTLITY